MINNNLIDKINHNLTSSIRNMIFGVEQIDEDHLTRISVINKILTLGFLIAYLKWKNDLITISYEELLSDYGTPNAKRVFDAFERIFESENIELDLIIYVLTEMQLDVVSSQIHRTKSYFEGIIFGGSETTIQIPLLRSLIKTWRKSVKRKEKNEENLTNYLDGLYNAFPFLQKTEILHNKDENLKFEIIRHDIINDKTNITEESYEVINIKLDGKELNSNNILIYNNEDGGYYYLSAYERMTDNKYRYSYFSLDGVNLNYKISTKFFLKLFYYSKSQKGKARSSYEELKSRAPIMAKSLFTISFKYIKNLALAISDVIKPEEKQKIYEHFSHMDKYTDLFEIGFKKDQGSLNWDNIITILIIEEGPTKLLEHILDPSCFYFDLVLRDLGIRYHNTTIESEIRKNYKREQIKEVEKLKKYLSDHESMIEGINTINRSLMAKCIVDGIAELEKTNQKTNTLVVESLAKRIQNIDAIAASAKDTDKKTIIINKVLEKTFRYLIPFYYGLLAFQKEKQKKYGELEINEDSIDKFEQKKEKVYESCEDAFLKAAGDKINEFNEYSLGKLVSAFRELCKYCDADTYDSNGEIDYANNAILLKNIIGRDKICDIDIFNKLLKIIPDKDMDLNETDILNYINNEKHEKNQDKRINNALFKSFIFSVETLLKFFIYNKDYKREKRLMHQIYFDPIYPYVVHYSTKTEHHDGYSVSCFTVFPSEENMTSEINILSEREYKINEKYYCIPNQTTSNSRWWIEPFLISCNKYDDLFDSVKSQNNDPLNEEE